MQNLLTLLLFFSLISCKETASNKKEVGLRTADVLSGHKRSEYEAFGKKYMISTQGRGATRAAQIVLDQGGNIYDAFAAASFAISVERPQSTGLGGGGFLVHHNAKFNKTEAIDFREMAPLSSHSKMYLDANGKQVRERSLTGVLAVGTPGLVAGVVETHAKFGSLAFKKVIAPAIELAEKGFSVYPALNEAITEEAPNLKKFPASEKIFFNAKGEPLKTGDILIQSDLARTLKRIAKHGKAGFYQGETADKIVKTMKKYNGLITHTDLKNYLVKNRKPVMGTYKGYKIASMPPPSSGGTHVIQILNILEGYDLKSMGAQSSSAVHLTSSAMQIAFADRAEYLGDDDFATVPVNDLISKKYAKGLREKISLTKALSSKDFPVPFKEIYESDETTHFTIMDSDGNIVTSTQTINGWFGSAVVAEGTGIVLNNEMDDFASHVGGVNLFGAIGGRNNLVEPKKRPLSSMSPTIVFKDKKPFLALGTPSGTRILTCVMQTVLNVLEHEMPLYEAVAATRYHHQWHPEEIRIGPPYFSKDVEKELKKLGHKINHKSLGCKIQAIMLKDGKLHGVSDMREEGMSFGK